MKQTTNILQKRLRIFARFSMFALLTVSAQGVWGQTEYLSLWDTGSNSQTILNNKGKTGNVAIIGRTLYRDGDWNTLCLPFDMDSYKIAESPLAGTTIKELDGTNTILKDGVLTLKFNTVTAIVAGKPYIVKWPIGLTISSQEEWNTFATNVAGGTTYAGQIVKLAANITVGTGSMVGSSTEKPFMGVFDGGGHTITCAITNTSDQGAAPFSYIYNATIMNVKVEGSVTAGKHCAGLVGFAFGTNTIKNCEVSASVTCTSTHCGGILGHGQSSTTTIWNCLFSGSITGSGSNTNVGVIYGWSNNDGKHTIYNCVANGSYNNYKDGPIDMMLGGGTQTASYCYQNIEGATKGNSIGNLSAENLVSNLGGYDWEVVKGKAVPKMTASNSNLTSPVFYNVTIPTEYTSSETIATALNSAAVSFTRGAFKGNYDELTINDANRNDILLLTSGNKLGYANTNRTLKPFRAYFEIPSNNGTRAVRSFELDFGDDDEPTGIISISTQVSTMDEGSSCTYDLQGRRVTNPSKGLYIVNGRKVVIK